MSLLMAVVVLAPAVAGETPGTAEKAAEPSPAGEMRWMAGAVAGTYAEYVGDGTQEPFVVPWIVYDGDRFYIQGAAAGVRAWRTESFSAGIRAGIRFGFDEEADDLVEGLEDRGFALEAGPCLEWTAGRFRLSGGYYAGIGAETDGEAADVSVTFPVTGSFWRIFPSISARWLSDDYVHHYYGIDPGEATPARERYRGEATTNLSAGIMANVAVSFRTVLVGLLSYERLGSGITRSPIVDTSGGLTALAGVAWRF